MQTSLRKTVGLPALAVVVAAITALATAADNPRDAERPRPEPPTGAERLPGDLGTLMLARPEVPVTRPRAAEARRKPDRPPALDGGTILGAWSRLSREPGTDWWILTFEATGIPPRRVLPCSLLEAMEAAGPASRFQVWGEYASYRGREYILPFSVATGARSDEARDPTSQPTSEPASRAGAATIDDIVGELLRVETARPLVPSPESGADQPGTAGLSAQGDLITDRVIRVEREVDSKWLLARFEADNALTDPPMRLLPCRMLGLAQWEGTRVGKLRVTGQVMRYKGKRYLLLRKVLPERRLGRF
jgi:hypothetical protein